LNLAGCPAIEASPEYEKHIIGPLSPQLKYINHTYIDDERRRKVLEELKAGPQGFIEAPQDEDDEEALLLKL